MVVDCDVVQVFSRRIAGMTVGLKDGVIMQIPIELLRTMCAIVGTVLLTLTIKGYVSRLGRVTFGGR